MEQTSRLKPIPEIKLEIVGKLAEKMKNSRTVLLASIKGLPAAQFQLIKTKLRGKAEIVVAKKTLVDRALKESGKGSLMNLKSLIGADIAIIFSEMEAFELAGTLIERQSPAKAKVGDLAPEDIQINEGPTDLIPGPAISELGAVGLKVSVENGKLAIKNTAVICKKGEPISDKVSNVLTKLNILPMKVGFIPVAAYDSSSDVVYTEIKIDKKGTLENLRTSIAKALGFAINVGYYTQQTVKFFIAKAGIEEKALSAKISSGKVEEKVEGASEVQDNNDKGGSA